MERRTTTISSARKATHHELASVVAGQQPGPPDPHRTWRYLGSARVPARPRGLIVPSCATSSVTQARGPQPRAGNEDELRDASPMHSALGGDHPNRHPRLIISDQLRAPLRSQSCLRLRRISCDCTPCIVPLRTSTARSASLRARRINDFGVGRLFENRLGRPTRISRRSGSSRRGRRRRARASGRHRHRHRRRRRRG